MVDVGVGEQHRCDGGGQEGEGAVVQFALGLRALEHAAVDEHARCRRLDKVAGAGDGAGGAMECEADGHVRFSTRP